MEFEFHVESGEGARRLFSLRADHPLVVGRGAGCDLQLVDPAVSRRHALLEIRDGHAWVIDLDSSNGVFLNGRRLSRGVVRPSDSLELGNSVLVCQGQRRRVLEARGLSPQGLGDPTGGSIDPSISPPATGPLWITHLARALGGSDDVERAHNGLAAIHRLSELLSEELEVRALLEPVLHTVFQLTGADRAAVLVKNGEGSGDAPVEAALACRRDGVELAPQAWVSRTIVREVLRRGIATLSRDALTDERFRAGESIEIQGIRSVLCAPVKTSRRILGVLYADTLARPDAFAETDLEVLAAVGNQAGIALHRARLLQEIEELFFDMVRTVVAAIDAKDGYTHRHSERVAAFAVKLAQALELPTRDQEAVQLCGLLHDVGKIGVPDAILNKPGALEDAERVEMERHPLHSVRILSNIRSPRIAAILPGLKHHHERWNGSGYPEGLAGEEIPFMARLVGVADALDALTSKRSYRQGLSLEEALALLRREVEVKWDPKIVQRACDLHATGELVVPREPGFERVRPGGLAGFSV